MRVFPPRINPGKPYATLAVRTASPTLTISQRAIHSNKVLWSDGNGDIFGGPAGNSVMLTRAFGNTSYKEGQLFTADPSRINLMAFPYYLEGLSAGIAIPTPGVIDFGGIPNADSLTAQNALATTFKGSCNGTVSIDNAACTNQTLNVADLQCAELRAQNTLASNINWPSVTTRYGALVLNNHRFTGAMQLPAFPNGAYLFASGNFTAPIGWLPDLSLSPSWVYCDMSATGARGLVLASNTLMARLYASYNRFGGTTFGGGNVAANFAPALTAAVKLYDLSLADCCFTEADLSAVIQALWSTRASRPAGILNIGGDGVGFYYPQNNGSYGANAPVIRAADRAKIADLVALGWTITYNKQIVMTASYLGGNAVRVTYGGPADIDIWAVGDTVSLTTTSGGQVAAGSYTVTARQSGKVWDLAFGSAVPLTSGQTVIVTVDK